MARAALLIVTALGCSDPTARLGQLPDRQVHVEVTEELRAGYSDNWVVFDVSVSHSDEDCPRLEDNVSVTANDNPLWLEPGGHDDTGACTFPHASAAVPRSNAGASDVTVEIRDRTLTIYVIVPRLHGYSWLELVEPFGGLAAGDRVYVKWAAETVSTRDAAHAEAAVVMLDPPFAEVRLPSGAVAVDGDQLGLNIPETATWSGPTELQIDHVKFPKSVVQCIGAGACTAARNASAATTIDLKN
jgi:hypothetical protein